MTHQARLNAIYQRIEDSIAGEKWQDAHQGMRELARLLIDATIASDNEQVALIDERIARVFSGIVVDDAFQSEPTLNSVGWSASGLRDASQMARKRRPPMSSAQRAIVLQDAEARILALLGEGNMGPRSNREIADRLELNVATVARTLGALRTSGKVRSWPEGRFMMNELASQRAEILSMEAANGRALKGNSAATLSPAQANVTRNRGVWPMPLSVLRTKDAPRPRLRARPSAWLDVVATSLVEREKSEKRIAKKAHPGLDAFRDSDVGSIGMGAEVIRKEVRPGSDVATNPAPDDASHALKSHHQFA